MRADKKKIKQAVSGLYDIQTKKINTLIRSAAAAQGAGWLVGGADGGMVVGGMWAEAWLSTQASRAQRKRSPKQHKWCIEAHAVLGVHVGAHSTKART